MQGIYICPPACRKGFFFSNVSVILCSNVILWQLRYWFLWISVIANWQPACIRRCLFRKVLWLLWYRFWAFFWHCWTAIIVHPVVILFIYLFCNDRANILSKVIKFLHSELKGWSPWKYNGDNKKIRIAGQSLYFLECWRKARSVNRYLGINHMINDNYVSQ